MLKELGLRRCAYDWRDRHIPEFEEEIRQYRRHGIEFFAFWAGHEDAYRLFEKHDLHPQIWRTAPSPSGATQAARVAAAARALGPLARTNRSRCADPPRSLQPRRLGRRTDQPGGGLPAPARPGTRPCRHRLQLAPRPRPHRRLAAGPRAHEALPPVPQPQRHERRRQAQDPAAGPGASTKPACSPRSKPAATTGPSASSRSPQRKSDSRDALRANLDGLRRLLSPTPPQP